MTYLRTSLQRAPSVVLIATLSILMGLGCGNGEAQTGDGEDDNSLANRRPGNDIDPWEVESVIPFDENGGFRLRMATDGEGTLGVAFFGNEARIGEPCEEVGGDDPPNKVLWSLYFSDNSSGEWETELVHELPFLGAPAGLDLGYDSQGRAVIATMTGEPVDSLAGYCGVNNVGVLTRESRDDWSYETAVSESDEAATGEPASDAGYVVGYWPALAMDSSGQPAVAYRDIHFGGIQADDFRRADLEFVHRVGGGWQAEPVDWGNGAGVRNRMVFDADDQPVIAYYTPQESRIEDRLGYWVSWRDDGEWKRQQIFNQGNTEELSVAIDSQGNLRVLFYDSEFGRPTLATLSDWENFNSISQWEFEDLGDRTYDEGYSPSLAISADGDIVAAYHRCTRASSGLGNCEPQFSSLIFVHKDRGEWIHEEVDAGEGLENCGQAPALLFDGDQPVIAYRCETIEDDIVSTEVRISRRSPLRDADSDGDD